MLVENIKKVFNNEIDVVLSGALVKIIYKEQVEIAGTIYDNLVSLINNADILIDKIDTDLDRYEHTCRNNWDK